MTDDALICRDCWRKLEPAEVELRRCKCGSRNLLTREAIETARKKIRALLEAEGKTGQA